MKQNEKQARPEGHSTNGIETHAAFLNLVGLETSPDKINKIADSCFHTIRKLRQTRPIDLLIPWHGGQSPTREIDDDVIAHYAPRLYVVGGTFDIAAMFLSPTLELASWLQSDKLLASGQDFSVCVLPTAECLSKSDQAEALEPLNAEFLASFSTDNEGRQLLPSDQSFVSITRLKFNPLALWPRPTPYPDREIGHHRDLLRQLWLQISRWRAETDVTGEDGKPRRPIVAIGLSFGWNEVVVVAQADDPGKLLRLSLVLRQPTVELDIDSKLVGDRNIGHVASTTVSTFGYDMQIRKRAAARLGAERERARGERIAGERLVALAREIAVDIGASPALRGRLPGVFAQVGLHTYPGHEERLLETLVGLRASLDQIDERSATVPPATIPERGPLVDFGKRDVWTPPIRLGGKLGPVGGIALVGIVQEWARHAGFLATGADRHDTEQIPHVFDFYTRIGTFVGDEAASIGALGVTPLPESHVRGMPSRALSTDRLREKLNPPADMEGERLAEEIRRVLRVLQLPYSLSEQMLNVVNVLLWASDREIIWDESVELVPPVLAMATYLRFRSEWWHRRIDQLAKLHAMMLPDDGGTTAKDNENRLFRGHFTAVRDALSANLAHLPEHQLLSLGQAFRTYFYNVHFSSYLTGEMPDLNLRYKGSVHQLLRIANMILDALTDVVMGPRASMAVFGDQLSPQVTTPCDVVVVHLNSAAFSTPLVLETLGHEVAHQFLLDLLRDREDSAPAHAWAGGQSPIETRRATYHQARKTLHQLQREVFDSPLDDPDDETSGHFIESAADFLEMRLFGRNYPDWLRSFILRALLAAQPTSPVVSERPEGRVPDPDQQLLGSAVTRAVIVWIIHRLLENARMSTGLAPSESGPFDIESFRENLVEAVDKNASVDFDDLPEDSVERVRRWLHGHCILGPDSAIRRRIVDPIEWRRWVQQEIIERHLPWLEDPYGALLAARFYGSLRAHAAWPPRQTDSSADFPYRGPARLWGSIRAAFKELWAGRGSAGDGIENHLLPSLYVRHWLNTDDRNEIREWLAEAIEAGEPLPTEVPAHLPKSGERFWATDRFPLGEPPTDDEATGSDSNENNPSARPIQTHVYQRGGVRAVDPDTQTVWNHATRRFLVRMLAMVPAWHRSVVAKLDGILERGKVDDE